MSVRCLQCGRVVAVPSYLSRVRVKCIACAGNGNQGPNATLTPEMASHVDADLAAARKRWRMSEGGNQPIEE